MFVPWRRNTALKRAPDVRALFENSFMPGTPETALDSPVLTRTYRSLTHFTSCRVCQTLYRLVQNGNPPMTFFEDYAAVCFFALHAPHTWTATVMLAADLAEIISTHFPNEPQLYGTSGLLGVDIQLHFFALRCFRPVLPEHLIPLSNLNFLKREFMAGALTGRVAGTFCFKTVWPGGECGCQNISSSEKEKDVAAAFSPDGDKSPGLLDICQEAWAGSELTCERNLNSSSVVNLLPPVDADILQGPCLSAPSLGLKTKNHTWSVCLLCEALAAHPEAVDTLKTIRRDALEFVDNNVQLVDRLAFMIQSPGCLNHVSDERLKALIKACTPQELHKHLFCDPLCLINERVTRPEILFGCPANEAWCKLRAALATGAHLSRNHSFDCEHLRTLTTVFKAAQTCKVGKTTFLEIVRELDQTLKKHDLSAVQTYQTAQAYV